MYSGYQNRNSDNKKSADIIRNRSFRFMFAGAALAIIVFFVIMNIAPDIETPAPALNPGDIGVRIVLHGSVPAVYLHMPPLPVGYSPEERAEAARNLAYTILETYNAEAVRVTIDDEVIAAVIR